MSTLMEMIAAEKNAAEAILEGKAPEELSAEEISTLQDHVKKADELNAKHLALKAAGDRLNGIVTEPSEKEIKSNIAHVKNAGTLGQRFVNSTAYKNFLRDHEAFESKNDSIELRVKAGEETTTVPAPLNTVDNGDLAPVRLPGIEDVTYHRPNTLLDLITQGSTNSPWLEYRQLISVENNARIVKESKTTADADALKPLSTLKTRTADAKTYTYADGVEATNQEFVDDGALTSLIDGVLRQNLRDVIEDKILNGAGGADEPTGILNTTGLLDAAFSTDIFESVRKAKTLLLNTSHTIPQALLLNPEDDEDIDLAKDGEARYYNGGPFSQNQPTLWGVPRVVSPLIPKGTALMGDFRQVQLLTYEAVSVVAFNQHKDYAQRNLTYIRAELRALQMIRQPAKLARIALSA